MLFGQRIIKRTKLSHNKKYLTYSTLCLSLLLCACQKNETEQPVQTTNKTELIQQDLVLVKDGFSVAKTAFTGTLRAVNQSSIQAQVTATATAVNAQVGQAVSKGQVLVRLNNQDNAARLAQAQANLSATQAQATLAKNMMQRKKRLLDQGFISKVEYEQAAVDYQAQLENVRAQQANVNIAQKADRDGTILSPISGVITKREVESGQTVAAGQTLFEIVDPNQLEIQAKLPSDMQAALKVGQKIEYTIQGNPAQLTAVLTRISPVADPASRQIEFFAKPNETINSLSIGSFVEGSILSSTQINGQLIPLDVIQNLKDKPYVWVIRQKKIEKVNLVILEQRYRDNLAVVQGLQPGDQISRIKFNDQDLHQEVIITQK
ncbi:efflux RND transporter periplasmic adaptor subunit [Acinetobacter terrae]|jgi:RND family efflux transporter MFP subunit|uniref:efflux RND transporter periplasmic adaptor subunit n=1 Tax=Acinetobacter terrae TaxID=2731247 RepID=UPI0007D7E539|nr:efflux RND transporter periplasmic adaptor subunit [Acinetobacter terrae]NNH15634.1 efflux RND transporter periplasmic adaptor subunit [Acinetobacter terrae]OAL85777.1 efflux transporter periplasmic adaptor subunit [Acinetobacter terrae]